MKPCYRTLFLSTTMLLPLQAVAHSSETTRGFIAGLTHPFGGIDHLVTLLLAGWFIGYLARDNMSNRNIKRVIPAIGLLILCSLWVHGAWTHSTEIAVMDGHFILGFLLTSLFITTFSALLSKLLGSHFKSTPAPNR